MQGDCSDDNCCEEGNYNTGVVVARQSGDVYVANECPAGRVLHFDGAGNLVGDAAIRVGTFPASISVRREVLSSSGFPSTHCASARPVLKCLQQTHVLAQCWPPSQRHMRTSLLQVAALSHTI
jgi:hypothetical protein